MLEQDGHGQRPLAREATTQAEDILLGRQHAAPHVGPRGLLDGVGGDEAVVVAHAGEAQPREVPGAVAGGVGADAAVGLGDERGAGGEAAGEAAQLAEQLVAGDVARPGARHGRLQGARVVGVRAGGGAALQPAQRRHGVGALVGERVDQLLDVRRRRPAAVRGGGGGACVRRRRRHGDGVARRRGAAVVVLVLVLVAAPGGQAGRGRGVGGGADGAKGDGTCGLQQHGVSRVGDACRWTMSRGALWCCLLYFHFMARA